MRSISISHTFHFSHLFNLPHHSSFICSTSSHHLGASTQNYGGGREDGSYRFAASCAAILGPDAAISFHVLISLHLVITHLLRQRLWSMMFYLELVVIKRIFHIIEDQYALKTAFWQTSLFRLQNAKLMMTTYNNLLMLEISRWSTY